MLRELTHTLSNIEEKKSLELVEAILNARRIFVTGAGRSGFIMKSFAMRLMHMGFEVYVIGETITPSISDKDLLIIGSGSGRTSSLLLTAKTSNRLGAQLTLITAKGNSSIGQLANIVLEINAPSKIQEGESYSIQPMGTLFEQSLLLSLDAIILILMDKINQNSDEMFERHVNIE
ncbi:6-phospho-3-hexuloisomerase [Peribacillus simplex]|uniref:6-phospho-3-hexuloisomerase n=1 Tax=Peribacillus simplex TaxID=1478 RepID=UPI00338F8C4A